MGNFYVRRRIKFTCVNKVEAMYGRSCVNIKVYPRLTLTCNAWPFKQFLYFTYARKKCETVEINP